MTFILLYFSIPNNTGAVLIKKKIIPNAILHSILITLCFIGTYKWFKGMYCTAMYDYVVPQCMYDAKGYHAGLPLAGSIGLEHR